MHGMPLFKGGKSVHTASRVSHCVWRQPGVPTPLHTECTPNWQGAKGLYNSVILCVQAYSQGYGKTASLSCPDIWVREPVDSIFATIHPFRVPHHTIHTRRLLQRSLGKEGRALHPAATAAVQAAAASNK